MILEFQRTWLALLIAPWLAPETGALSPEARELAEEYLRNHGWRQGRDRLWRNDTYGGSWRTENAVRQEAERPVRA